jgi:histidinol-phosphate aminotransferase
MASDAVPAMWSSGHGYLPPGEGWVKLNQNESPYALAPEEWEALWVHLRSVPLHRYPDPAHAAVEEAIARLAGLSPSMVLAGNGANELLELLVRSTCEPGDEVLTVAPTYPLYDRFCAVNRVRLVKATWGPEFAFPRRELLAAASPRTRLVLLCRPNNPTGHLYPAREVLAVAQALPCLVAVDEAYGDFAGDTVADRVRSVPNLAVVRTLSKAYGAAGLRFGYLLASPETVRAARALQTPYGLSGFTQAAALFLLSHPEAMRRRREAILAGREDLIRRLGRVPGLTVFPSSTNFVLVRTAGSADALDGHLRARRIAVRNLKWDDRHLRISVGTAEDHARLAEALEEYVAGAGRARGGAG